MLLGFTAIRSNALEHIIEIQTLSGFNKEGKLRFDILKIHKTLEIQAKLSQIKNLLKVGYISIVY